MTTRDKINALKDIIRKPVTWPGMYDKILFTLGGVLCSTCCKKNYKNILHSTKFAYNDDWEIVGLDAGCNYDDISCTECRKLLGVRDNDN